MSKKPFNYEAAMSGKPVLHFDTPVAYYGRTKPIHGHQRSERQTKLHVVEDEHHVYYADDKELFMAPVYKTMWVQVYKNGSHLDCSSPRDTEAEAASLLIYPKVGRPHPIQVEVE
jgi:hypothetical protein